MSSSIRQLVGVCSFTIGGDEVVCKAVSAKEELSGIDCDSGGVSVLAST